MPVRLTHIEAPEPLAIDYRPVAALIPYARNARTPTGARGAECPSACARSKTAEPLAIDYRPIAALIPYARNARTHSEAQVALIAGSIREYGFTNPVLVDGENGIIAGHGRVLAARKLGLATVPVIELGAPQRERRSAPTSSPTTGSPSRPAGTASCWRSRWRTSASSASTSAPSASRRRRSTRCSNAGAADPREEETPEPPAVPVSQPGDLWLLGRHRLLCGSATDPADVARLLGGVRPHLMATDPPYGVSYDPAWRNRAGAGRRRSAPARC